MKKRSFLILLICLMLTFTACGGDAPEETTAAAQQSMPETTAATEPQLVYETQTVWLCVLETMTNYENNSVFKTEKGYNEYGQLVEQWRPEPDGSKTKVTQYIYDEQGNNIEQISEYGRYVLAYDEQGRLLSSCYYSDEVCKSEYHYTYDDAGYLVEEVYISRYSEETVNTYKITYNEDYTESFVQRYTDDEKTSYTRETYDAAGNVLTSNTYDMNDAWKSGSTYEYDDQGRLAVEQRFSRSETQADYDIIYTYDENGLLITKNVDYYYGYLLEYTYEPFEILVRVN